MEKVKKVISESVSDIDKQKLTLLESMLEFTDKEFEKISEEEIKNLYHSLNEDYNEPVMNDEDLPQDDNDELDVDMS